MAKNKDSIKKSVGKKKINHYNKADCQAEIARLDTCNKDKNGVVVPDASKYRRQVEERLAGLS